jgi:riboflavin synthase
MFTGLVEAMGTIVALDQGAGGVRLAIAAHDVATGARIGDSICISGCCLTVVGLDADQFHFDAGPETLRCTTLGLLRVGSRVNLERSLQVGDRLGGHFVTGHVDAIGRLDKRNDEGDWVTFWFSAPAALTRQMARKGSIAVDGVSLTLVEVTDEGFSVALIPHTLAVTTLGKLQVGDVVNLETDVLAKYVERQITSQKE